MLRVGGCWCSLLVTSNENEQGMDQYQGYILLAHKYRGDDLLTHRYQGNSILFRIIAFLKSNYYSVLITDIKMFYHNVYTVYCILCLIFADT